MSEYTLHTGDTSTERRAVLAGDVIARFERILEIRGFEERLNVLFATGAIHGTTHLAMGQEALAVALAAELRTTDTVTATYRGHALALALGMSPRSVLAEIMGRSEGSTGGLGGSMHVSDASIGLLPTFAIVGAGLPVAAGSALAAQYRGEDNVAVAVFGDGATNIGAFHESLNLAAIWKLPVVFVCDNNLYGEYSRINLTTPIEDLHLRAASYDMPGTVVDGMDVGAVRSVIATAVARARSGGGPTLVEAKTYRFGGHSRADTAPYRIEGEMEHWRELDPVLLARKQLEAAGSTAEELDGLEAAVGAALDAVIEVVEGLDSPNVKDMFNNVWSTERKTMQ
jgi:TPP-dependent pyruvate/acetoin dehydrogenase alpha subunit